MTLSAQSGMERRIERRAESRIGVELEGFEEWQAQRYLRAGLGEGLRNGEEEEWWNLESIFGDDGDSFAD